MSEIVEASELLERRNLISFFSTAQHSGVKNLLASFNYPYNTRTSFCTDAMKNTTMDNDIAKCFYLLDNSRTLSHNIFDPINKKLCTGHPKWEPSLAVGQACIGHHAFKGPRQLILSDYSRIAWLQWSCTAFTILLPALHTDNTFREVFVDGKADGGRENSKTKQGM